MDRIVLASRRSALDLPITGRAFAVVAPDYEAPAGIPVVSIDEVIAAPETWFGAPGTMVVVGLSRMMTPANRVKLGRAILRPRPGIRRISVDEVLFISEPWRLWWHFHAVGESAFWGLTDSFLAETRWKRAIELQEEDLFGVKPVREAMRGIVRGIDPFRFSPIDVEVRRVSARTHTSYAKLKERLFTHEKTIGAIIKKLAAFAQNEVPERSIPSPSAIFKKPPTRIMRTDLKVDEMLVGALLDRVTLTNAIADASLLS